eukprot:6913421-Ditylum_brightwellii.AAC.1
MNSSQAADAGGSSVGAVKGLLPDCVRLLVSEAEIGVCSSSDKCNSELILCAIIAPVVGEFDRYDATGVTCSNSLGKNKAVDLAKIVKESGVDIFVDFKIGASYGFVVELDDMMVPEHSFQVCVCTSVAACGKGMEIGYLHFCRGV